MAVFKIETITDAEGNVSFADETCIHLADIAYTTKQLVEPLLFSELMSEPLLLDHWSIDLACAMITVGCNEEVFQMNPLDYINPHERMMFVQIREICNRCKRIALTSLSAGLISDPDTPAKWIAWAKAKGYSTRHLEQQPSAPVVETTINAPVKMEEAAKQSNPVVVVDYASLPEETIINADDVMQWLKISRMTLNRRIKDEPLFPKPFKDGNLNKWEVKSIKKYITDCKNKGVKP